MYKRFLATILSVSLLLSTIDASAQTASTKAATADQQAMDKLLAPIALYPDALLAQVLACASSPQQVTEVNKWLTQNSQLQGSELQEAAEKAGFDASFIAMVLFPDVLKLLEKDMPWTTEIGKAFTSDQKAVLDSVQRLRVQAKAAGNLKTTPQQEVKTETQNGQQVIVIQPANPQVVYVPVYNTQTVYVAAPPEDNSGEKAAAALIGFGLGIALGVAMSNNYGYYGWGAWGMHWHSHVVVVHGGAWRVPPRGRYAYARPVAGYHPNTNINAPRYNNVNVNVNNVNVNRQAGASGRTPRPATTSAARPASQSTTARTQQPASNASRGRAQGTQQGAAPSRTSSPAKQMESGSRTSAFSGYQNGSKEKAASSRGRSSSRSSGGGRRQR